MGWWNKLARELKDMPYVMLVYKDGKLIKKIPYNGYSGHAMMDEIKYLYRYDYRKEDGYELKFKVEFND